MLRPEHVLPLCPISTLFRTCMSLVNLHVLCIVSHHQFTIIYIICVINIINKYENKMCRASRHTLVEACVVEQYQISFLSGSGASSFSFCPSLMYFLASFLSSGGGRGNVGDRGLSRVCRSSGRIWLVAPG
jgi:hypothetical protein